MWEKELKYINGLGKLYPAFRDCYGEIVYENYVSCYAQAAWVVWLCVNNLKQRIPSLEKFIRKCNPGVWEIYRESFGVEK